MKVPTTQLLFAAWALAIAVCDCRSRRIPNSLIVSGLAAAFACSLFQRSPFGVSLWHASLGASTGLVALLPFFALGLMGGADVKVFSVLGAWCGAQVLLGLWVAASLAAGAHAIWLLLSVRSRLGEIGRPRAPTFDVGSKRATPYAACLTVPAIIWLGLHGLQ